MRLARLHGRRAEYRACCGKYPEGRARHSVRAVKMHSEEVRYGFMS